jgi:thioesterase-3
MTGGKVHRLRLKVRGYHVDMYGHVNHARYLEFMEEARWSLVEQAVDLQAFDAQGFGFVVVRIDISFRRPARVGDELEIRSWLGHVGGKSAVIRQDIHAGPEPDAPLVTSAEVTFVIIDKRSQRAVALEGELRTLFEQHLMEG